MIEVKERESGLIAIDDLKVYQNNARTHSNEQVQKICASFKEFGVINPVLIDENNMLLAGHGRLMAAEELNMDHINYIRINDLTENQKKAYVIADNQHALNADWDYNTLKIEMDDLLASGFDIDSIGLDLDDLDKILGDDDEEETLKEESYSEEFNIIVKCDDELHQEVIYNDLVNMGLKCQVQSL